MKHIQFLLFIATMLIVSSCGSSSTSPSWMGRWQITRTTISGNCLSSDQIGTTKTYFIEIDFEGDSLLWKDDIMMTLTSVGHAHYVGDIEYEHNPVITVDRRVDIMFSTNGESAEITGTQSGYFTGGCATSSDLFGVLIK